MNLADLLRERQVPVAPSGHHHITTGRIQVDCPVCSPNQHRWRLGIHESGRYLHCWSCGRLPVVRTLAELLGISVADVIRALDGLSPQKRSERQARGKLTLPKRLSDLHGAHRQDLLQRGFDPDEIAAVWAVKGIGIAARLTWRLFIPAILRGDVLSWTTRSLSDTSSAAKYISASPDEEHISLKDLLYGEDLVAHTVVICEGPADAWRIGPGAVATFGASFTPAQVVKLTRYPVRVICYDGDQTGRTQAQRLLSLLSPYPGKTFDVLLEGGKDPASAPEKEVKQLRKRFLK
jgi:hypothetical protein